MPSDMNKVWHSALVLAEYVVENETLIEEALRVATGGKDSICQLIEIHKRNLAELRS